MVALSGKAAVEILINCRRILNDLRFNRANSPDINKMKESTLISSTV